MPYTCSNDEPFSSERCTLLCPHSTCQTCICLLLLVSLKLAFSSCATALFLLGLFWGLPRSHRLSSHSRLNAFVIQTKLNFVPTARARLVLHCITQPFKQERAETTTLWGHVSIQIKVINSELCIQELLNSKGIFEGSGGGAGCLVT